MKKVILLSVFLVFLVGCGLLDGGESSGKIVLADFKKGISGLEIKMLEGLPAKEFFEGSNFKIGLDLRNRGGYDIYGGEIEIAGFDERYVLIKEKKKNLQPIAGKNVGSIDGGFYVEEFQGQALKSLEKAKEYKANYYAIATYDYRSEAQVDVCINTNLYSDLKLAESCKPQSSISLSGQGAPVAVTKVEEIIIPEDFGAKVVFKIYVENKGRGYLTSPVYLEEVKLGVTRLTCEQNFLDLEDDNNNDFFICTGYEYEPASYASTLYAGLTYTYKTIQKNSFTIKSIQV